MSNEIYFGGQAVIEGVMMKSPTHYAVAVQKGKRLIVQTKEYNSITESSKIFKIPFLRGVINLIEMMVVGMQTLIWSANQQVEETEEKLSTKELALTLFFSFAFAIGLFIVLPLVFTKLVTADEGVFFNIIDGGFRIAIFIAYIVGISLMKDVKRLFQFHGAEHKVVNCYEAGKRLTPKNAQKFTTLHPRCGTSFILIVLAISVVVFSFVTGSFGDKLFARIILIQVIAGIAYEVLKFSAKHQKNPVISAIIYPGLMVQKLTTREPSLDQLHIAIVALRKIEPCKDRMSPKLEEFLGPGKRVLDIGCGTGVHAQVMSLTGAEVHAIDNQPNSFIPAYRSAVQFSVQTAGGGSFTYIDEFFDVVTCLCVLNQYSDKGNHGSILNQVKNVLKPGGVFHLTTWGQKPDLEYYAEQAERTGRLGTIEKAKNGEMTLPQHHFSKEQLDYALLCFGFTPFHYEEITLSTKGGPHPGHLYLARKDKTI